MTNREYAIKKINEVLERIDDTMLADIFIELMQFPEACKYCANEYDECNCLQGVKNGCNQKILQGSVEGVNMKDKAKEQVSERTKILNDYKNKKINSQEAIKRLRELCSKK